MSKKHPLIQAIELKNKALKKGCHPRIIASIEDTIRKRAKESVDILTKSKLGKQLLKCEDD